MGFFKLGDQDPDDVQEKEEVHLCRWMVGGRTDVWVDDMKVEERGETDKNLLMLLIYRI